MKNLYNINYTDNKANTTTTVAIWSESVEQASKDVTFLAPWRTVNTVEEVNANYFNRVLANR